MGLRVYRYSIAVFFFYLMALFLLYGWSLLELTFAGLKAVDWVIFALSVPAGYMGSLSFTFPLSAFLREKRQKLKLRRRMLLALRYVYNGILGKDNLLGQDSGIDEGELRAFVRSHDILSIVLLTAGTVFFVRRSAFLYVVFFLCVCCGFWYAFQMREKRSAFDWRSSLLSLLRYGPEILVPLVIFAAVSIDISLWEVVFFTASSSLLYYLPPFRLAGGVLDIFITLFVFSLGHTLIEGFVVVILFRAMSVLGFILPFSAMTLWASRNRIST